MANDPVHFVFDLDDTLYFEEDYVRSALRFVGGEVAERFSLANAADRLLVLRAAGEKNPIGRLWDEHGLPPDIRSTVLDAMRAHVPAISLRPDAADFIDVLRADRTAYAIVTDGRSVTQRAKISALNCLDAAYISVSEEVGLLKTDPARFAAVEERLGEGRYVYVGDNPAKDFAAPNGLGWLTIMLVHDGQGVHGQHLPPDRSYHPQFAMRSFAELAELASCPARGRDVVPLVRRPEEH
ncbi:MAG: hypothetical protein ABS88_15875 [Sphingopyxis sp. SCN 67-31]|nr:MAG: hypothetical protein ABS88_15875 [Sphingopyxis sp. SCN 67-31]